MRNQLILSLIMIVVLSPVVYADDYLIGEGDILNVSVWGNKDLSIIVKVRPDGKITVPALGDIVAAGNTPKILQEKIAEELKSLVKNPIVTVIVEGISNNKVYVFGGGTKSGVIDLNKRTTLVQLLCLVGEFNNADLQKAYVLRNGRKIKENFHSLFMKGDVSQDILILPNDIIFIPAFDDSNVYVVGAINLPKNIKYREGLTVMEAILESGGFSKFAKANSTVVYRKSGDKEMRIPVKLQKLMDDGDLSQNVKLRPGDTIVISEGIF